MKLIKLQFIIRSYEAKVTNILFNTDTCVKRVTVFHYTSCVPLKQSSIVGIFPFPPFFFDNTKKKKMSLQHFADCLNEIIEYLEDDEISLRSCLLVSRLWCKISVRILWRNILKATPKYVYSASCPKHQEHAPLSIISTLIACLPNESKELLYENEISIPTPTQNPPLFNYTSFIKAFSFLKIENTVKLVLSNQQINTSKNKRLVLQELLKAFMSQISSLRSLNYDLDHTATIN